MTRPTLSRAMVALLWALALAVSGPAAAAGAAREVTFTVHSARGGNWSDPHTWAEARVPAAGDAVQVCAGHTVVYDRQSDEVIRVVHVAGTLTFARDRSTSLTVGLLKVQPGDSVTEDGFACDSHGPVMPTSSPAALEMGTAEAPVPALFTATVRLAYVDGADPETCPAIIVCGGRWDVHGAPLARPWLKLAEPAASGASVVRADGSLDGWRAGDRVILTPSELSEGRGRAKSFTEERVVTSIDGDRITLDRALESAHGAAGDHRAEIADLSRNVVIESAAPGGVRGHTMYHLNSAGSISYAEFRHLGKRGVLGKYPIHFHLAGDSMRGSSVVGASVWDSDNRWLTVHGTNHLLVRDCVGYRSVGHGFFLEDATEAYNVFDRNLAVGASRGKPLPKQVLNFDPNEGAGFWWANGRNAFVRNVACDNAEYGYRFQIERHSNFDTTLPVEAPDGTRPRVDVRTLPFLRFESNEAHCDHLYAFNFGDDRNRAVRGDERHPFIARDLHAWQEHYALRPNLSFFLMERLRMEDVVYGVYHPDYDAHVYRDVRVVRCNEEPINRGHDDESVQYGSFTYDGLTLEQCRCGRDPLIQLACTSPNAGVAGHFRGVTVRDCRSPSQVVDLGGGPRNSKLQNPVAYFFHDFPSPGVTTEVLSARFPEAMAGANFAAVPKFTGPDVRAAEVATTEFPKLLDPVDDLPPSTAIRGVRRQGGSLVVSGVTVDNGAVASVAVNGVAATVTATAPGVVDWIVTVPADSAKVTAVATDAAGNVEPVGHTVIVREQ